MRTLQYAAKTDPDNSVFSWNGRGLEVFEDTLYN